MKTLITSALMVLLALGGINNAAFARGLVSKSFSRPSHSFFSGKASANKWRSSKNQGLLKGLLIGSLLTSLFMGHGLTSGLLTWVILIALVAFIISRFTNRRPPNDYR